MGFFDSNAERDKDETIRRLTEELLHANERASQANIEKLEAVKDRKDAVHQLRELQDVLQLKEALQADTHRALMLAQDECATLQSRVTSLELRIVDLQTHIASLPVSDAALLASYERLRGLFDRIDDALSCPICYSPFSRAQNQANSLACGHTFCEPCFSSWATSHLNAWKNSPIQGAYPGPECPECRSAAGVRRGKVRVWAMEEVIRLVERGRHELDTHTHASAATAEANASSNDATPNDTAREASASHPGPEAAHQQIDEILQPAHHTSDASQTSTRHESLPPDLSELNPHLAPPSPSPTPTPSSGHASPRPSSPIAQPHPQRFGIAHEDEPITSSTTDATNTAEPLPDSRVDMDVDVEDSTRAPPLLNLENLDEDVARILLPRAPRPYLLRMQA